MADGSPFFISVVIVNYNGAQFLERCLASLAAQTYTAYEIILVDNASTDSSREFVTAHFPQVKLVRSETNVGFAAGNNLGIRHARGEFIATLNTDTRVEPDYLEKLCAPMTAAQDAAAVGACAPLMLEMERPEMVDAAGIRVDRFGFAWNLGAGERANKFATTREVYGACAGAALYRRAMLDQIGWFDDAYFGFYEDADLAWRARRAGWKTVFAPRARVYHVHGASFGKISPRKTYLLARNRWWTMRKNYSLPSFVFHLPLILILDFVSLLQAARRGHFREAWRGRVDGWRGRNSKLEIGN
ncbi:MAG: glycosyltransferase family 2 protein [Chloroflexi bacterium]|nr:glycosyltransferase family 2 protein [Chloroflexota bacterium]